MQTHIVPPCNDAKRVCGTVQDGTMASTSPDHPQGPHMHLPPRPLSPARLDPRASLARTSCATEHGICRFAENRLECPYDSFEAGRKPQVSVEQPQSILSLVPVFRCSSIVAVLPQQQCVSIDSRPDCSQWTNAALPTIILDPCIWCICIIRMQLLAVDRSKSFLSASLNGFAVKPCPAPGCASMAFA